MIVRRRFRLICTWFRARNRGGRTGPDLWGGGTPCGEGDAPGEGRAPGHDSIPSQSEGIWITGRDGVGRGPRTRCPESGYMYTHVMRCRISFTRDLYGYNFVLPLMSFIRGILQRRTLGQYLFLFFNEKDINGLRKKKRENWKYLNTI